MDHTLVLWMLVIGIGLFLTSITLGILSRRVSSTVRRDLLLFGVGVSLLVSVLLSLSAIHRWLNPPLQLPAEASPVFEGVHYLRDERADPRPIVTHILFVDLKADGVRVFVTPSDPTDGYQMAARTTTEFARLFDVQVAINGDGYHPWEPDGSYPRSGDPVDVIGYAVSNGTVYATGVGTTGPTLFITTDNRASIGAPPPTGPIHSAISGKGIILRNGDIVTEGDDIHPRTGVALDQTGRILMLIAVDGRQHGYSLGVTLTEFAEIAESYGAWNMLNLDGGGSTTMVRQAADGNYVQLNRPVNAGLRGIERPVGNHLGIYANSLDE